MGESSKQHQESFRGKYFEKTASLEPFDEKFPRDAVEWHIKRSQNLAGSFAQEVAHKMFLKTQHWDGSQVFVSTFSNHIVVVGDNILRATTEKDYLFADAPTLNVESLLQLRKECKEIEKLRRDHPGSDTDDDSRDDRSEGSIDAEKRERLMKRLSAKAEDPSTGHDYSYDPDAVPLVVEQPPKEVPWPPRPTPLSHVDRPQPKRERNVQDMDSLRTTARRVSGNNGQAKELSKFLQFDTIEGTKIADIDPQTVKYVVEIIRARQESSLWTGAMNVGSIPIDPATLAVAPHQHLVDLTKPLVDDRFVDLRLGVEADFSDMIPSTKLCDDMLNRDVGTGSSSSAGLEGELPDVVLQLASYRSTLLHGRGSFVHRVGG